MFCDHRALGRPAADVVWQLEGGAVDEQTSLSSPLLRNPLRLPGVLEGEQGDGHVHLLVTTDESDRVLVALVQQGWHVESVSGGQGDRRIRIEARRTPDA